MNYVSTRGLGAKLVLSTESGGVVPATTPPTLVTAQSAPAPASAPPVVQWVGPASSGSGMTMAGALITGAVIVGAVYFIRRAF